MMQRNHRPADRPRTTIDADPELVLARARLDVLAEARAPLRP